MNSWIPNDWLPRFQQALKAIGQLEPGWDSYDGGTPGSRSSRATDDFLLLLERNNVRDPVPDRIAPSVDGGIVVSFLRDDVRANIEFFDNGEIVAAVAKPGRDVRVWEVENTEKGLMSAVRAIRNAIFADQLARKTYRRCLRCGIMQDVAGEDSCPRGVDHHWSLPSKAT